MITRVQVLTNCGEWFAAIQRSDGTNAVVVQSECCGADVELVHTVDGADRPQRRLRCKACKVAAPLRSAFLMNAFSGEYEADALANVRQHLAATGCPNPAVCARRTLRVADTLLSANRPLTRQRKETACPRSTSSPGPA